MACSSGSARSAGAGGRGLVRLAEVLDDLLTEGQAELEELLPF